MLVSVVLRAITVGLRIGYLASVISFGVGIIQDFGDDCFGGGALFWWVWGLCAFPGLSGFRDCVLNELMCVVVLGFVFWVVLGFLQLVVLVSLRVFFTGWLLWIRLLLPGC